MTIPQRFVQFVERHHLFKKKDRLLVAVSGGVDSVVLCELCYRAGLSFSIAHCNFMLRGGESERDERFVRSLSERYQVPFYVRSFNVHDYAKTEKISIQVAARYLRYEWFNRLTGGSWQMPSTQIMSRPSPARGDVKIADYLLTAHHADDNLETMLMNFFKGTGISGLRAMEPLHDVIRRPLLFARKKELVEFASENNLSWVEDSSNALQKYSRNQVRHSVIPAIAAIYPSVEENLLKNIERFSDIEQLYTRQIGMIIARLLVKDGNELRIPVLKLRQQPAVQTVCFEIIKDFNFTPSQAAEMVELFDAETGKYLQSATHRIIRHRDHFIIAPLPNEQAQTVVIEKYGDNFPVDGAIIDFRQMAVAGESFDPDPAVAMLDAEKIQLPLILRKRRQGDYFYPLGMKKKKKISRFLSDLKLSVPQKEKVWILEMDKKIIWVVGHRIDERFKVTGSTKTIIRIQYRATIT